MSPLAALLLALPSWAQSPAGRFELAPSTPVAVIGAPFEIRGTAAFPEGYALEAPGRDSAPEPFALLSIETGAPVVKDGTVSVPVRIRAAAFGLGDLAFPSMRWPLKGSGRSPDAELESPPVPIKVSGPQPEKGADIRDIAGPIVVRIWPWFLAAALFATGAAYAVSRRRPASGPSAAAAPLVPDTRTPDEIAIDDLRALAGMELPIKEYYDRLSDILRLYLDRRFQVPALKMTTADLQRSLVREELLDSRNRTLTKTLLDRCDLAKFARFLPTKQESAADCETAIEIIRSARPQPEPSAAQPPQGAPA